jgi:hypothetical protein
LRKLSILLLGLFIAMAAFGGSITSITLFNTANHLQGWDTVPGEYYTMAVTTTSGTVLNNADGTLPSSVTTGGSYDLYLPGLALGLFTGGTATWEMDIYVDGIQYTNTLVNPPAYNGVSALTVAGTGPLVSAQWTGLSFVAGPNDGGLKAGWFADYGLAVTFGNVTPPVVAVPDPPVVDPPVIDPPADPTGGGTAPTDAGAVPEPATFAMMGAGLAVVGIVTRRKK